MEKRTGAVRRSRAFSSERRGCHGTWEQQPSGQAASSGATGLLHRASVARRLRGVAAGLQVSSPIVAGRMTIAEGPEGRGDAGDEQNFLRPLIGEGRGGGRRQTASARAPAGGGRRET